MSTQNNREPVIVLRNIVKKYFIGKPNELEILHGMDITIYRGEFVSIVGESGSGKSTLMNIIGALDRPTSGEYTLNGIDMMHVKDKEVSHIRNQEVGFVFQTYNLIGRMNAIKNVELPMLYAGIPGRQRMERAEELLELVGMKDRMKHQPNELSGGQKQRVAIARAMANNPSILLADEPTGALDSQTSREVMDLFHKVHDEQGVTIVLITHNQNLAEESERIITISDGRVIGIRKGKGMAEHGLS
jgi:putative ABC transport system ATP-binding protein